ncbi:Deoxyuridine 5'-triphosphate nucleotidohydrolase [Meristemomyces frigidus]|nr:Deoxyuridine 5'-triphosphate nucleotidohydrolase [Meristemomyces frigidus]
MASELDPSAAPFAAPQALPSMPPMAFEPPPPATQVKLLSESAKAPTRGLAFAAGYDLYAAKEAVVPARGKVLVDTDISIAVPAGTYGRVAPRSGLASKHSIDTGAGVIDADYRGPVKVLLFNLSDNDFKVAVGEGCTADCGEDSKIYTPDVVVVDQLEETVRGTGGFGSTGGFGGALPVMGLASAGATGV